MRDDIFRIFSIVSTLNGEIKILNEELKQVLKHSIVLETEIKEATMSLISLRENSLKTFAYPSKSEKQLFGRMRLISTMNSKQNANSLKSDNLSKICPTYAVLSSSSMSILGGHDSRYPRSISGARNASATIKDDARLLIDELLSNRFVLALINQKSESGIQHKYFYRFTCAHAIIISMRQLS